MSRSNRKKFWYIFFLFILALLTYPYFASLEKQHSSIRTFKECVDAGYSILETYPEQCKMPGKSFTNPDQVKETSSPKEEIESPFLNHSYLVNGTPVYVTTSTDATTTSSLHYDNLLYKAVVSQDTLEDTLFIAKKTSEGKELYYIFLALGLYNGSVAPANGIFLGEEKPLSVARSNEGHILVTLKCSSTTVCTKKFVVKNDILEPQ